MTKSQKPLSAKDAAKLMEILEKRFESYPQRHKRITWKMVTERLAQHPAKLRALQAMEETGGEPDVVEHSKKTGEITFYDCSAESPSERRSTCFDRAAQKARKEHAPKNNALDMAEKIGIELLTEAEYRNLQKLGEFDTKTSSWIATPEAVRKLDGALFADRRYDHVFVYHNGAQSYYAARGFRGKLII